MDTRPPIEPFVAAALADTPIDVAGKTLHTWDEGGGPAHAESRLRRILDGDQRASALPLAVVRSDGGDVPVEGDLLVVRDGRDRPRAVVEVIEQRVVPFDLVDEHFAADCGEGDLSLRQWRETHRATFEGQAHRVDAADPRLPVVTIRFRLVYPCLLGA
ncbi:MAG: ASCH domain-containing protein [Trueperaceae bacterium]|nr:MAG: ASCH domain-containing protein [Trueperaceae bacterium]